MNCQQCRESLPALIDGELSPEDKAKVEEHLGGCEECRAEEHRQKQFTTRVKTSLEDLRPSEMFVKGVLDRLEDPKAKKQQEEASVRRTKISLIAAGLVILVVLLGALVVGLFGSPKPKHAARVIGYEPGKAWLLAAGGARKKVPIHLQWGSKLRTDPGGRVVLEPAPGVKIEIMQKSTVSLRATQAGGEIVLDSGGLLIRTAAKGAELKAGAVSFKVDENTKVQISAQHGQTAALHLVKGSAALSSGKPPQQKRPEVGEVWFAPLDGSEPPRRKPEANEGKLR